MQLKIDVDAQRKLSLAALRRRARIAHVVILSCVDTRSPSDRGWHRVLEVDRVTSEEVGGLIGHAKRETQRYRGRRQPRVPTRFSALEIVALQLLFGSDPIREAFNMHRARLVDRRQVPPFWRRRWNNLYATSAGK